MSGLPTCLQLPACAPRSGSHPVDRRPNAVHLTVAGKMMFRRIEKLVDGFDAELMAVLPAEDGSSFQAHLHLVGIATGVADGLYPTFPDGSLVAPFAKDRNGR